MNWYYKFSQSRPNSYFDIGWNSSKEQQLWIWYPDTGEFLVSPAQGHTHEELDKNYDKGSMFSGRYENYKGNKRVSVKGPYGNDVPEDLMAELVSRFGKDIKIVFFL